MRDFSSATIEHLIARSGVKSRLLFWISARNRETGTTETLGLWTGDDSEVIEIDGIARTYHGAGSLLGVDPIVMQVGVQVRMQRVMLSPLAPEVAAAVLGYDARLAPVEIHRALFDPVSGLLIAPPDQVFKGWVDQLEMPVPAVGSEGMATMTLASSARILTRTLASKYSDASMQMRGGDRLFRYADVSGSVPVYWGEKKHAAQKSTTDGFGVWQTRSSDR